MRIKKLLTVGLIAPLFVSCVDDKYDLSDIDTTSEFKVNDLVLPVNLDPVLLSDIIHVKEGEKLKEVTINGSTFYAVEQTGDFRSDDVNVHSFTAEPDPTIDKVATFVPGSKTLNNKRRAANDVEVYYLLEPVYENIEYEAQDIDGSVRELTFLTFNPFEYKITLSTSSLQGKSVVSQLKDMQLEIPIGLTIDEIKAGQNTYTKASVADIYNASTGILSLGSVELINNEATISLIISAIDLNSYKNTFTYNSETNSGSFDLKSQLNIKDCKLQLTGSSEELASISEINYAVHYDLEEMSATSFLGNIEYNLEGTGLYIEPIDLTDLPSFLKDPETDLVLANPQIYINLDNIVGEYGLSYQSTLDIIVKREGEKDNTFRSPLIKVPAMEGEYNYLLAPDPQNVTNIPSDYAKDLTRLTYENLGNILAGNGLPEMLDLNLIDPMIPEQTLTSPFELDKNIEGMEGNYMFLAPLALREGSKIVKTIDGWWSEDLEALTINILKISATASSDVPMEVILNVYPIDKDGNRIPTTVNSTVKLPAMASDMPIELIMEGNITDLDGIQIYVVSGSDEEEPLEPTQTITLENLKAKVTGNYTRKL